MNSIATGFLKVNCLTDFCLTDFMFGVMHRYTRGAVLIQKEFIIIVCSFIVNKNIIQIDGVLYAALSKTNE